jgi:diguanylate cyclase (GGDEF)-like protein
MEHESARADPGVRVDVTTLFFVEASLLFLFGLTMIVNSIGRPSQESNYWFAASNFCGALGLFLHSAIPHASAFITVVLADFLLFVELSILNKAIAEFVGHGRKLWLGFLCLSFAMTAAIAFNSMPDPSPLRIGPFVSAVTISTAMCSAILLFGYSTTGLKVPQFVMGTLFSLYAANNIFRLFQVWSLSHYRFYYIWLDRTVIAVLSFGYLLMTAARLRNKLEKQANTDHLTGTLNRRAIEHQTLQLVTRKRTRAQCISVLMLDLDYFKEVNDTYGHYAGDLALRGVADCLRETMRAGDLIARLGGDEFLVVMSGTSREDAEIAADRLSARLVGLRIRSDSGDFGVQASIGIISLDSHNFQLEDLMKLSDRALYAAKSKVHSEAKDVCKVASPELAPRVLTTM